MHLFFYPIADSYWFVLAVALALLLIVALVGPGKDRVSAGRRLTLGMIRCVIVLLVVAAMLRPTLVHTEIQKHPATLVLLIDQTRSMMVGDCLNNKTRWESLLTTLKDCVPALRKLERDFEVKAYTFDAETHPVEVKDGRPVLPEKPTGQQTAIGPALDDMLNEENGKRLLGIVVLTDGRQQALAPRDTSPQDVAARLRRQSYPVFPVVFGQSRGLGGVQDVAVVDFPQPAAVFVKTEMAIHAEVKINGYVNKKIPVRLLIESPEGKMEERDRKEVAATAAGNILPVDFTYTPETPGEFKVTVKVDPQPDELVTTNNERSSYVRVLKGGLHVLYIEGELRVEQKFIRRSLDASRDIKVDSIRIDPLHVQETRPSDLAERLKPGKYDVYILGDVDSTVFTHDELEQLKDTVNNHGKGLIMLGGFHSFGPGGYSETPLAEVLPVKMDKFEREQIGEPTRGDVQLAGLLRMQPTPHNLGHFALSLAAGAKENAAAWAKLPKLDGANRFAGVSAGASILAEGDGKEDCPLLVSQEYGSGRVIAFAGDSTWRWVMHGFGSAHKRFWRQIVLWLAHKDQMAEGSVWVQLENTRYVPGDRVDFTAGAHSPQNEPITDAEFKAEVINPEKKHLAAVMIDKDDLKTGSFRETLSPGDYTIEVTATRKGETLGTARARFIVAQEDLELDNASADIDSMKGVAKSSGGDIVEPEQLSNWLTQLMKKTDYLDEKQETRTTLWDSWPFFVTVVVLLTGEWYLRKRWGLV